jgi:uncharacterized protein (DUF58 family)
MSVLSPSGWVFLVSGVAGVAAASWSGSPELLVMAAALLVALAASVVAALRRPRLTAHRQIRPERLEVGEEAEVTLVVGNPGPRRSRRAAGYESLGDRALAVQIPPLDPGAEHHHRERQLMARRGRVHVGPLRLTRGDPFGLTTGTGEVGGTTALVVHPRTVALAAPPAGQRRDLDGPTSDEAPEGGLAFHALREYAPGDDLRLVHWRSTARSGQLMVRKNVDTHQPFAVVLLDVATARYSTAEDFEAAVSAAASLVRACAGQGATVTLATSALDEPVLHGVQDGQEWALLDRLAEVEPGEARPLPEVAAALGADEPGRSLVVLSGDVGDDLLAALAVHAGRHRGTTVASFGGSREEATERAGMRVLRCGSLEGFARAWNGTWG